MTHRMRYATSILWTTASLIIAIIVMLKIRDYQTISFIVIAGGVFIPAHMIGGDLLRKFLKKRNVTVARMPQLGDGSTNIVSTDIGSHIHNPIARGIANLMGDLGINIVFVLMIAVTAVFSFLVAYFILSILYQFIT